MNILVTPRLILRPLVQEDLENLIQLYDDPEVRRYLGAPAPEQIEAKLQERIAFFEKHGYGMYAVIDRREKRFVGRCGLEVLEGTSMLELAFILDRSVWHKGYATEASKEILRAAFSEWKLESIVAITDPENRASIHVLHKLGMQFERHDRFYDRDCVLYGIQKTYTQPPKRPFRQLVETPELAELQP
jgi:ribosomal-protein-alanine N-acetyltransferase